MTLTSEADLGIVRNASPAVHSALALLLLIVASVLAVYKPSGMTPMGGVSTVSNVDCRRRRRRSSGD